MSLGPSGGTCVCVCMFATPCPAVDQAVHVSASRAWRGAQARGRPAAPPPPAPSVHGYAAAVPFAESPVPTRCPPGPRPGLPAGERFIAQIFALLAHMLTCRPASSMSTCGETTWWTSATTYTLTLRYGWRGCCSCHDLTGSMRPTQAAMIATVPPCESLYSWSCQERCKMPWQTDDPALIQCVVAGAAPAGGQAQAEESCEPEPRLQRRRVPAGAAA